MNRHLSSGIFAVCLPGAMALLWSSPARAGVELEVFNTTFQQRTCVSVNHACTEPSAVTLTLDSTVLLSYDTSTPANLRWIPEAPCIDTTQFGNGFHNLSVQSTCGATMTTDSQTINIQNPDFGFNWVAPSGFEYNYGEPLTITAHLGQTGLGVGADFSAIDPGYTSGSEVVVDNNDGTYTISYMVGSTAWPAVGTYPVILSATDGTSTLTHDSPDLIRYAPYPTPRVRFADNLSGEIVFAEPPTGTSRQIAVIGSTLPTTDVTIGGDVTITLEVWTATALADDTVILNLGEAGGSGYIQTVAPAINGSCGRTGCFYDVEAKLTLRALAADTVPSAGQTMNINVSVGAKFGVDLIYSPFGGTGSMFYRPETEGPYAVIGQLRYQRVQDVAKEIPEHSKAPQYLNSEEDVQVSPVADTEIVLYDGCNNSKAGRTYADGSFAIIFDTPCPQNNAHLELRTEAHRDYLNVEVTDYDDDIYQEPISGAFQPDDAVYVGTWTYWLDEQTLWNAVATLQQAIRVQRGVKTYLVGNSPVLGMPKLRARYAIGTCTVGTSQYSAPDVEVCGAANNNDARHEFAMTHEFFHWYQDHFMPDLKGNTGAWPEAGSFGEGFATMMPTLIDNGHWNVKKFADVSELEDLDYSGNIKTYEESLVEALPVDLYVTTDDQGSGGWTWRILWDFYDTDSGSYGVAEPESNFSREPYGGGGGFEEYGDFDKVGDPAVFKDIILDYLGGNHISENLAGDPMSPYYYMTRGVDAGLGLTEFLDGALCRSSWNSAANIETLVNTVMDFQSYEPNDAPTSCP